MENRWIHYNPRLKQVARTLRKNMTCRSASQAQHSIAFPLEKRYIFLELKRPLFRGGRGCVIMVDRWVRYNPRLKQIARTLRKNMTLAEILLWQRIKGKQLLGYDFHGQKPINEFVVDFYCPRLKLVVEIDGDSHEGKEEADHIRQEKLESMELTVMRFWDSDVKSNVDGVIDQLREWIGAHEIHP